MGPSPLSPPSPEEAEAIGRVADALARRADDARVAAPVHDVFSPPEDALPLDASFDAAPTEALRQGWLPAGRP